MEASLSASESGQMGSTLQLYRDKIMREHYQIPLWLVTLQDASFSTFATRISMQQLDAIAAGEVPGQAPPLWFTTRAIGLDLSEPVDRRKAFYTLHFIMQCALHAFKEVVALCETARKMLRELVKEWQAKQSVMTSDAK